MAKRTVAKNSLAGAAISLGMSQEKLQEALDAHMDKNMITLERDRAIDDKKWHMARLHDFSSRVETTLEKLFTNTKPTKGEIAELIQTAKNLKDSTHPQDYL